MARAIVLDAQLTAYADADAARSAPAVQVQVTVAASTLIGLDDEPADIARDLAADDATWRRILTDPTGAIVDVGTRTYRPSARIGREVRARNPTCVFPGCAKPALHCDLDHVTPFAQGGETTVENLAPECRFHHRVKTHSRWQVKPHTSGRGWRWTSPTGHTYDTTTDPPPH